MHAMFQSLARHIRLFVSAGLLPPAAGLLTLASASAAQSSGFHEGELFIYSSIVQTPGYNGYAILRVDPLTGANSVFTQTVGAYPAEGKAMAFDAFRQRLVFSAAIGASKNQTWLADGAGNLQSLTSVAFPGGVFLDNLAPTQDGRIYCHSDAGGTPTPLLYFDAANILRVLYDSDGATPMKIDGGYYAYDGMIHDAATNSLFVASTQPKPGFPLWDINVRKLPLSADGSRVIGPVGNSTFAVSPTPPQWTSGEYPRGWSHGPNGQLVLCTQCIDFPVLPRMLLVDPVTSAISVWGSNGSAAQPPIPAWAYTPGGAYSSVLDKVVVVDLTNASLRAYAQGSAGGPGSVIATTPALSGFASNSLHVVSVPDDNCTGQGLEYGTGLAGTGGFVPHFASSGCPDVNSPFTLAIDKAIGGGAGMLLISATPANVPLFGGTLLVGLNAFSLGIHASGSAGAAGVGAYALPLLLSDPSLTGASVYLQAGFLDAGATQSVSLTNGLQIKIG
jgi:hypothetical protein